MVEPPSSMKALWQTARIMAWLCLALAGTRIWWQTAPKAVDAAFAGLNVVRDVPYRAGSSSQRLDVFLPTESTRPAPVIVALHGGSWTGGSRTDYGRQVADFARHGCAVVVPDYRLSRPGEPGWPTVLDDLREVVRWVRRNAGRYSFDSKRVAVLGSGAGGHLAALLGLAPPTGEESESSRVQAVIDLYGPTDLRSLVHERHLDNDPVKLLVPGSSSEDLLSASPLTYASPDDPPVLILHGSDDQFVAIEQSQRLAARLVEAGANARVLILPGERHGFELRLGTVPPRDLVPEILAFLQSVWQVRVPAAL